MAVNDPACGAGALLIAFANECRRPGHDINFQTSVLFVAQDIDFLAGMMCYIQLSLMGCPGYVVIDDSISHPITGIDPHGLIPRDGPNVWYTPMYFRDVWHWRRLWVQMDRVLFTAAPKGQAETLAPEPPRHKWAYIVRGQGRPADTVLMGGEKMRVSPPLGKRTWTAEEENYLRESWGTVTVDGICRHLNRTKNAIMVRVNRLGFRPTWRVENTSPCTNCHGALGFGASSGISIS